MHRHRAEQGRDSRRQPDEARGASGRGQEERKRGRDQHDDPDRRKADYLADVGGPKMRAPAKDQSLSWRYATPLLRVQRLSVQCSALLVTAVRAVCG